MTRDETAELVSRDQILRGERGQGNVHFSCSVDCEQDSQPYPLRPYSAIMGKVANSARDQLNKKRNTPVRA